MPIVGSRAAVSARALGFGGGGPSVILLSATPGPSATISTYSGYIVFKFTATGTLNVGAGAPGTADVFVVAGGATGSPSPGGTVASGGNGGSRTASPAFTITANTPIPVVVGGTATDSTFGPVTSSGGTAGGAGGTSIVFPPTGTTGSPGGDGPTNDYETGSAQNYGGGGGASGSSSTWNSPVPGGAGGLSGGGYGGSSGGNAPRPSGLFPTPGSAGGAGTANTGGGGGGGGYPGPPGGGVWAGGTGGSGVVIVRFPNTQFRTS